MLSFHFLAMVRNLQDVSWKGKTIFKGNVLKDSLASAKWHRKRNTLKVAIYKSDT